MISGYGKIYCEEGSERETKRFLNQRSAAGEISLTMTHAITGAEYLTEVKLRIQRR